MRPFFSPKCQVTSVRLTIGESDQRWFTNFQQPYEPVKQVIFGNGRVKTHLDESGSVIDSLIHPATAGSNLEEAAERSRTKNFRIRELE